MMLDFSQTKRYKDPIISTPTVKPVLSGHSKRRPNIGLQDRLSLNADPNYCRMLILLTFIKLPFIFGPLFCLFFFEWPLKTGFTVLDTISIECHFIQCVAALDDRPTTMDASDFLISFLFRKVCTCTRLVTP